MESSETGPKEFKCTEELLPLSVPGICNLVEFKEKERDNRHLEHLKSCGLTNEDIQLYRDEQEGTVRSKMENGALREKLEYISSKLEAAREMCKSEDAEDTVTPGSSKTQGQHCAEYYYPPNHPIHNIKQLENDMFDHLKPIDITPINKRRKILRRLQRREEATKLPHNTGLKDVCMGPKHNPNSLWDVKDIPLQKPSVSVNNETNERIIGPKPKTHYTIKDNKIVRLEPVANNSNNEDQEYRAVDIVVPVNQAEERLLEGTQLSIDQIRNIERFKNYKPGKPSKVLFLKNISPAATADDISILFNQFIHENRAPVNVRLMTGRLRGQAFVHFQYENVAIQALEDVNGTVVKGRPVIAQFGRSSNNIQNNG